jgi:ubiquinone/menaquinone biosynthesis C-methylase UbiE
VPDSKSVADHYTRGNLAESIRAAVRKMGKSIDDLHIDDLGAVDEFHIGGRIATERFLDQLGIESTHHLLDVGCGLGGSSRFAAQKYACRVTGIDLTREYVETGNMLCAWVGLDDRIRLEVADATALPHAANTFDRVCMLHVGMNIANKERLASELHRVVQPGGRVGIYDIMRVGDGDLVFPFPWATEATGISVATPATYRYLLERAGFRIVDQHNRREFALDFLSQLRLAGDGLEGPPPLGLHLLMGSTAPVKVKNMIAIISAGLLAPIETIAEKARMEQ